MITPGICQFCSVTEEQIDGDKLSWHNNARNVCSKYGCVKQYRAQIRAVRQKWIAAGRKRTPAEVYELQLEERRKKNRRYRDTAKARGLIKANPANGEPGSETRGAA